MFYNTFRLFHFPLSKGCHFRCLMTHYEVLGVSREASIKDIKSAYIELVKKHHPDSLIKEQNEVKKSTTNAEDVQRTFVRIQEAYSVLSNEVSRRHYDARLSHSGGGYYHENYQSQDRANPRHPFYTVSRDPDFEEKQRRAYAHFYEQYQHQESHEGQRVRYTPEEMEYLRRQFQQRKAGGDTSAKSKPVPKNIFTVWIVFLVLASLMQIPHLFFFNKERRKLYGTHGYIHGPKN